MYHRPYNCQCDCGLEEEMSNPMFGQSYVPIQYMKKTFEPEVGLKMGTVFPELVSPYVPYQSIREIEYIKATNQMRKVCGR